MHNSEIAHILNKIADLLEIKGENRFRIRAYRDAARTVDSLPENVIDLIAEEKDLTELPGIGKDLAAKIQDIAETGTLRILQDLEKEIPSGLVDILNISGIGPKKVNALYTKLHIRNISDLKKALQRKAIRELEGFGIKTEESIAEEIKRKHARGRRITIQVATQIAEGLRQYLQTIDGIEAIEIVGSYRRRKETIGDIDILVTASKGCEVMDKFMAYPDVKKIISKGERRTTVLLKSNLQVDLRVFAKSSYGAARIYFTGSKEHNIAIRQLANKNNLKINEYGVYRNSKKIAGATETEVYKTIKLDYIEPELRENHGEIEAARKSTLPHLITVDDIRGDLHAHSNNTDGKYSIKEMAEAAKKRGYDYLALTDHSSNVRVARGLNAKQMAEEIQEIDKLNARLKNFVILKGIEVDILEDGSLDMPDAILKELDVVICAIHSKFHLSKEQQTARILKALDYPYCNIFAHPTGRLLGEREPYDFDIQKIMEAAKERGCALEVSSHPARLDLNDTHCHLAKTLGVKLAISTDAHSIYDFDFITYGVDQARRGWVEAKDVINTYDLAGLKTFLRKG